MTGACILVIYLSVLYGVYVPDWQFSVQTPESPDYGRNFTVSHSLLTLLVIYPSYIFKEKERNLLS